MKQDKSKQALAFAQDLCLPIGLCLLIGMAFVGGFYVGTLDGNRQCVRGFTATLDHLHIEKIDVSLNESRLAEATVEEITRRGLNRPPQPKGVLPSNLQEAKDQGYIK